MTEQIEVPDEALKFIILGAFSAVVRYNPNFPVMVDHLEENYDEEGQVETFSIITRSGLRFTVRVDYEPAPPIPKTQEEKIAFRKDWDARVKRGE